MALEDSIGTAPRGVGLATRLQSKSARSYSQLAKALGRSTGVDSEYYQAQGGAVGIGTGALSRRTELISGYICSMHTPVILRKNHTLFSLVARAQNYFDGNGVGADKAAEVIRCSSGACPGDASRV